MGNSRVRVDWDGDGFTNKGVSSGTPPNIYTASPYMGKSNAAAAQFTTGDRQSEDVYEVNDYGLSYRRLQLGGSVDAGETAHLGYEGVAQWQPNPGDPANLLEGSSRSSFPGINVGSRTGGNTTIARRTTDNPDYSLPATDLVGDYVLTFDNYIDTSNTYTAFTLGYTYEQLAYSTPGTGSRYDGANQYLNTGGSAVDFAGFPCSPSTTYTFICQVWTNYAGAAPTVGIRAYGPSATLTTPNFGRAYVGGSDTVMGASGTWNTCLATFTTGASQTSVAFAVSFGALNTSLPRKFVMGGAMLLLGTHAAQTSFWDNVYSNNPERFSAVLESGKDYRVSFWARSATPATTIDLTGTASTYETFENTEVSEGAANFTGIGADWVRCDITLPSRAYERGFSIDWTTIEANGTPISTVVGAVLEIAGLMVTEGSATYPYHAGTLYEYDDITSLTLKANTKSGRGSADNMMAFEGIATLELNNEDRLFSPENTASPLFAVFAQNRRIEIEYLLDDVWVPLWTGWTYQIDVTPGENNDNRATLVCNQGFFRMRESSFTSPIVRDTTIGPVIQTIMEEGGWRAPKSPYQSNVGYNLRLDENFFVSDGDMLFSERTDGINLLQIVGQDWGRKTEPEAAVKALLESENAVLWIARDGRLVVVDRNYWVEDHENLYVDLDTTVQEAEYSYGQGLVNHVEISLTRKKLETATNVWETKKPFRVKPRTNPTDVVVIEIHAEHVEGRQKTVLEYTLDGMVKTVYTSDPGLGYGDAAPAGTVVADRVSVTLVPVGAGLYRLKIVNDNPYYVWVDIELKGDYLATGDGVTIIFEDEEAIAETESLQSQSISNTVVGDELQAASMGAYHVLYKSQARGEFSMIEYTDASEILGQLQSGTQIVIHETQTDQTSERHFVIGEDFTIQNDLISVKYTLMRGFADEFILSPESAVYPDDDFLANADVVGVTEYAENFVENQARVGTYNGGTVEFTLENDIRYNTGYAPNLLFLDSPVGQVVTVLPGQYRHNGVVLVHAPGTIPASIENPLYLVDGTIGYQLGVTPNMRFASGAKYRAILYTTMVLGFTPTTTITADNAQGTVKDWTGIANANDVVVRSVDGAAHTKFDFLTVSSRPYGYAFALTGEIGPIAFLQYSNVKATKFVGSAKYHLFAKREAGYPSTSYTLTVYDSATGAVVGSDAHTVGGDPVHFEATLSGLTSTANPEGVSVFGVFATFGKTTEDYTEHEIVVLGYGVVPDTVSVAAAADLHKTPTSYKLYP